MLLRRQRVLRAIAMFLLINISTDILWPTVSYALTAGPTAPEATSFEPVDTTDMVNPLTGDFTYNLPLIEVPGPEGGYPLSLSYHAGIQPNEEASWVGLGWSLNPGAITRSVNGYADDYLDVAQISRSYWGGGSRSTLGITVGTPALVNFGLSFSKDTYQGFGIGSSIGWGPSIAGTPFGVGVNAGTDGYGNEYAAAGLKVTGGLAGMEGMKITGSVGISTNFSSVSTYAGADISYSNGNLNQSLLGASISSAGGKASLTVGGGSANVYNANVGKIQTESSGSGFGIPLPGGFSLGISYNYMRYWSDETASVKTNGTLNMPQSQTDQAYFNDRTFDVYRLLDPKNHNIVENPDPDWVQGGTFPAFDDYTVTAQGLSGNIRPYIYQSVLYSQNQPNKIVQRSGTSATNMQNVSGVQYRFVNDFSNAYRQSHPNLTGDFTFGTSIYGNQDGNYGYNTTTNHLAGSKHIQWFSNLDISGTTAASKGFINTKSAGFIRLGSNQTGQLTNTKGGYQVGGYMITNASGVTYHYALPAYTYNEYSITSRTDTDMGTTQTKLEPYAYTWYLTAITGPDFVDRGIVGELDEQDWGYWVSFDYGKWAKDYNWRNPSEGYHRDIENKLQSYSKGQKEVYYLDAIKTRTHTALFVKEIRADGKSLTVDNGFITFNPTTYTFGNEYEYPTGSGNWTSGATAYKYPKATLRLNKVLLYQNDQLNATVNSLRKASANYVHNFQFNHPDGISSVNERVHFGENIIDLHDINSSVESTCLRKVSFNFDYSLSPKATNSCDPRGTNIYSNQPSNSTTLEGKLTLLSVDFQGKGGVVTLPPIKFEYELDATDTKNQNNITINQLPTNRKGILTINSGSIEPGDILKFVQNNNVYYCTILKKNANLTYNVLYLEKQPTAIGTLMAIKTKNPPYNKDAYDIWGMYKSDYEFLNNQNLSRLTSETSIRANDVYSLRKIKTSIGANIEVDYEGDTYNKVVINGNKSLLINSVNRVSSTSFDLFINTENRTYQELYKVGDKIKALLMFFDKNYTGVGYEPEKSHLVYSPLFTVEAIADDKVTVSTTAEYANNMMKANFGQTSPQLFKAGNISANGNSRFFGGGIRVKNIILDDLNTKRITNYDYKHLNSNVTEKSSSGVTSYEPIGLEIDNVGSLDERQRNIYRKELYTDMNHLLALSRELPAPGVMYEYVTIQDKVISSNGTINLVNGKTVYNYRVFNKGMLGIQQYQYDVDETTYNINKKNLSIKDYTSQIGNLIRTIRYDDKGNRLTETINHFLNDDIVNKPFETQTALYEDKLSRYNYQGFIQERYADGRSFWFNNKWLAKITMAGRDVYPSIQTGTTQIDYKNGTRVYLENLGFDFYSGSITKTINTDSYGNRFETEIIPAYRQYAEFGLKTSGSGANRKHMLTQQASSTTYKVNALNERQGILAASAQTWAKGLTSATDPLTSHKVLVNDENGALAITRQNTIWRQKANYQWRPSGTSTNNMTLLNAFQAFNFTENATNNVAWQKAGEIKRYNVYSNALEGTDLYENFAATRMGYKNSKVLVTASPARYEEVAYAGAEDPVLSNGKFSSQLSLGTGVVSTNSGNAHTGEKSLKLSGGQQGFVYEADLTKLDPVRRDYSVMVWVKPANNNVSQARLYYKIGTQAEVIPVPSSSKTAAGWYLLELKVPASALASASGTLTVGCKNLGGITGDLYFDDFRFQPTNAAATAYVYDLKSGELTHILDNNNLFTRYEYDAAGRLIKVYKEVLGKSNVPLLNETVYNYGKFGQ